jgi:hypothetical protein
MAKSLNSNVVRPETKPKGTSIGNGHFKRASLNKRKKASYKKYRGQGR